MKTADYLDALRARLGLPSDYAIAKRLGVPRATISKYRTGARYFDNLTAYRVADLLDVDPLGVIADMEAERATRPELRDVWLGIAARFKDAAIVAAMAIGGAMTAGAFPGTSYAAGSPGFDITAANTHCRTKRRRVLGVMQ